jgi:hypothetical protein
MYFIILSRQDVSKLAPFRHTKMMTWLLSCATWFFFKKEFMNSDLKILENEAN